MSLLLLLFLLFFIAVLKACKQDFAALNDIQKNHSGEKVLRLEGLPWDSKENDIRLFFGGNMTFYSRSFTKRIDKKCLLKIEH